MNQKITPRDLIEAVIMGIIAYGIMFYLIIEKL